MQKNSIREAWKQLNSAGRSMILREYFSRVVMLLMLFLISGNWSWPGAWIMLFFALLSIILIHLIVVRPNPDLYNERGTKHSDTKRWDMVLLPIYGISGYLVLIIASLDERYQWSTLPAYFIIPGILFVILACVITTTAMYSNAFFSSTVRIQAERGQTVVDQGPYRIVRHPGYLGGICFNIGCGFLLNSIWAFIPILLVILILSIRIRLEENTLLNELPGYKEYTQKVRYRLFPGIW